MAVPPSSKTANDAPNPVKAASRAAGKPVTGQDRLNLDASVVTGNRELPRVLVIVPWKKADLGELNGKPSNSLLDEAVAPLDREVFRREILYYNAGSKPALTAPASGSSSGHD